GEIDPEGKIAFRKIPLFGYNQREIGSQWSAVARYDFRLWEKTGGLVADDGYQIMALWEPDPQGKMSWRQILPHERKAGEYELLTPEQRMKKAMADLQSVTGYNGEGYWEQRKNTVVDYTDTQGKPHHQEVEVYAVHADQDPSSPVVYEVIKDPATGEMMFTIRAAKKNQENIRGLNEQQAALVRQAWAYLLAADPEVMRKFWRVNNTLGVCINPNLPSNQASSNRRDFGLIIINPIIFNDLLGKILTDILQESYELYGGFYGWGEGWKYTNPPPDCLDGNLVRDAALRVRSWLGRYGNKLSPNVFQPAKDFNEWGIDFNVSFPCQP
ncbi:MAG: hypothetical protein ACK4OO_05485, partial [bacterium]